MNEQYVNFDKRRKFCLITGLLSCIVAGVVYAWSVIQGPLVAQLGGEAYKATIALGYTVEGIFATMGSAIFGGIIKKLGTRRTVIAGGLMISFGYIVAGRLTSIPLFLVVFGFFAGTGNAFIYPTYVGYLGSIYPEKRGVISGIVAAALGGAAIIWSPVLANLIELENLATAFLVFGVIALIVVLPGAMLIKPAPEGYDQYKLSEASASGAKRAGGIGGPQFTRGEMVKTATFYTALFSLICGCTTGAMVITQVSSIMQESFGLAATSAATFVSFTSFMSMAGRLIWGTSTDYVDKLKVMAAITGLPILAMGILSFADNLIVCVICMGLTAFCYGGIGGSIMPIAADLFGAKHASENFAVLFICFSFAALLGPQIAVRLSADGDYSHAFMAGVVLSAAALTLALITARNARAMRAKYE